MLAGSNDWNNYTFELTAQKISGKEGMMIHFGFLDGDNFYDLNLGGWNNTLHAIQKMIMEVHLYLSVKPDQL